MVAQITAEPRLVMEWQGQRIVDLSREFLNTNGSEKHTRCEIAKQSLSIEHIDVDFTTAYPVSYTHLHTYAYALERAQKCQVPTAVVEKKDCAGRQEFEGKILELLAAKNIDLLVLAGFMTILSADFTSQWPCLLYTSVRRCFIAGSASFPDCR